METTCSDKPEPMTVQQCDCRRRTTKWWVGGIGTVVLAISAMYVVPAISAGYKAQAAIDSHLKVQEEFAKRMDLRFTTIDQKLVTIFNRFETSWKHDTAAKQASEAAARDRQGLRDLILAGGVGTLPDSTE